jgi:hypothetical protein
MGGQNGNPALAAHPPVDHMTRKLLRRSQIGGPPFDAVLEQLCVDTVYVQHSPFDEELGEGRWEADGFVYDETGDGAAVGGGDLPAYLISRRKRWNAGRRCVVMARITASHLAKFEFGFSSEALETVLVKDSSTLNANPSVRDFAVAIHDKRDDSEVALVAHGVGVAGSTTMVSPVPDTAISAGDSFSLMVALNEQEEARWWIDGIYAGVNRTGPATLAPLGIWVYANAASISIDYIRGWQEREPLVVPFKG